MELLGRGSLTLALVLACWATVGGVLAGTRRDRRLAATAERALVACFASVALAAGVLWTALLRHDFRFEAVASYTSRALPLPYRISALWGSQPGSLLLWLLILTGFSALVVLQNRRRNRDLMPWVCAVLGGIAAFFALVLVAVASPFTLLPGGAPPDGSGLNPSLQNPYMMAHPPMLYLGYVGFSVPFAFAMAALLAGRTDERWISTTRRWTLAAWAFLGGGMLLGAHWAYVAVGWGGFWAWDPVENAALIPWLVGTAFLHSVIVQEKKGMLKVWNVSLVSLAFCLSILGTFLTRSGVTSSIHSFALGSSVGWFLILALGLVASFAVWNIVTHLPLLRARHRIESVVSREASFLFNNLLFVALAFAVLWGVLFPILTEAVRGERIAVSKPYYDFFAVVFGLPLLALAGLGPLLAWRRASLSSVARSFRYAFLSAAAAAALLVLLGYGSSIAGVVALSLCLFVAVCIGLELARGTAARHALAPERGWARALGGLIGRNRRRYGGYIVHLSVVVMVVGIVGSTAYASSTEQSLRPGQSLTLQDYTLTFRGFRMVPHANNVETQAVLTVRNGGRPDGVVTPGRLWYAREQQAGNAPVVRSSYSTGSDLFVILNGRTADGTGAQLKVLINPLVNLLWLGGLLFAAGALVAIWPDPRAVRRLARRTGEQRVAGETA